MKILHAMAIVLAGTFAATAQDSAQANEACNGFHAVDANGFKGVLNIQQTQGAHFKGTMHFGRTANNVEGFCHLNDPMGSNSRDGYPGGVMSFIRYSSPIQYYSSTFEIDHNGKLVMENAKFSFRNRMYDWHSQSAGFGVDMDSVCNNFMPIIANGYYGVLDISDNGNGQITGTIGFTESIQQVTGTCTMGPSGQVMLNFTRHLGGGNDQVYSGQVVFDRGAPHVSGSFTHRGRNYPWNSL